MQSVWIPRHGAPDVLELRETPDPQPGPGEVRIAVRASGLNFAEIMARQGMYPDAPATPCVVGYEVAGEVDAVGAGVGLQVGARVAALCRFEGHASLVCVPEAQAFPMAEGMSFEEGAALPVNYVTAYHMLSQVYRVRAGDHVLVHMAAGGVGTAALQLCASIPGVTSYGTASASKHDHVRAQGCDHVIDYRSVDYVEAIREQVGARGLDLVLDPLGGKDWKKGYGLLRPSGMLIAFGWANMNTGGKRNLWRILRELISLPLFTPVRLMDDNRAIAGVNLGHMWDEIPMLRGQVEALMNLYEAGHIRPHVDRSFPFSEAAEAHRYLEQGKSVGKVLLIP